MIALGASYRKITLKTLDKASRVKWQNARQRRFLPV
jgi:hypothetical protein